MGRGSTDIVEEGSWGLGKNKASGKGDGVGGTKT